MVRISSIKWDRAVECRPPNNIVSSDFHRYYPQPWKFMEGPPKVAWLLSYEYQRKWIEEREAWKKRMYPENLVVNVDVVKRYVQTFKANYQPPKPPEKKSFKIKKYDNVKNTFSNRRSSDDKAMAYKKLKDEERKNRSVIPPPPPKKTE